MHGSSRMKKTAISSVLSGTVGGALGTAFMQKSMQYSDRMPEKLQPPPMEQDPGEFIVEKVETRRGRALEPKAHRVAAKSLHWVYGMGWGGALGVLAPRIGMNRLGRSLLAGAAMGAGVWAVGYAGWLPRAGLTPPLREQRAGAAAGNLGAHIGYGMLAALPIYLANRFRRRR